MKFLILTATFFFSIQALATDSLTLEQSITEVKRLISKGEFNKAFDLANEQNKFLGEPNFDFLLGLAALKTSHPHEAVFAFERVVNAVPAWTEARLQLATAYFKANNIPAAQSELEQVSAMTLKTAQKSRVDQLNQAINRRLADASLTTTHQLTASLGQDSNINAGTAEDSIFIPSLNSDVPLLPSSKETEGHYFAFGYNGRLAKKISQQQKIFVGWGINDYQYGDNHDYNRTIGNLTGQYRHGLGENTYIARVSFTPLLLKGKFYRMQSMLGIGIEHPISKDLIVKASAGYGIINNKNVDNLDVSVNDFKIDLTRVFDRSMHRIGFSFVDEDAKLTTGSHNAKDGLGFNYQYAYVISDTLQLATSVAISEQTYDGAHPTFLVTRKELLKQLSSTLQYKLNDEVTVKASLSYQDKKSNLNLYEYDRYDLGLSGTYRF